MQIRYPSGELRDQDRDWVIYQLSGGDSSYAKELESRSDHELKVALETEMAYDMEYWSDNG